MSTNTLSPADALREAARDIEHDCEYDNGVVTGYYKGTRPWSADRIAENGRKITQSRALHARADALENR